MNAPMYQIGQEAEALLRLLEDLEVQGVNDKDVDHIVETWLAEIEGAVADKAARVVRVVQMQEALAAAAKQEAKRLTAYASTRANHAERLRDALQRLMVLVGTKRIETPVGLVTVAEAGGKQALELDDVDWADPDVVPPELTLQPPREPNKEAIRAQLEGGVVLPFARLKPRTTSLRIK